MPEPFGNGIKVFDEQYYTSDYGSNPNYNQTEWVGVHDNIQDQKRGAQCANYWYKRINIIRNPFDRPNKHIQQKISDGL